MPQKTKKTSIAKPAGINYLSLTAFILAALSFIITVKNSPGPFFRSWTESSVRVGNCFRHRDRATLAQVVQTYESTNGARVKYAYVDPNEEYYGTGSNDRGVEDFESLYSLENSCATFTQLTTESELKDLKRDVTYLKERLDDAREEISVLRRRR